MVEGELDAWLTQLLALPRQWIESTRAWLREMREAQARAEALLRDSLSEAEYATYRARGHLEVPSRTRPGRIYQIPAHGGRVRVFEQGRFRGELCVGPVPRLPAADIVLTHKLMIEGCEEDYLHEARWIQVLMPFTSGVDYWPFGERRDDQQGH